MIFFFELETLNYGYLLILKFPLTVQSFRKIGQSYNRHFIRGEFFGNFLVGFFVRNFLGDIFWEDFFVGFFWEDLCII